jgi:hypothetical protein
MFQPFLWIALLVLQFRFKKIAINIKTQQFSAHGVHHRQDESHLNLIIPRPFMLQGNEDLEDAIYWGTHSYMNDDD